MRITLDHNCLLAVENSEPMKSEVERIVASHGNNLINVSILGISGSERQLGGSYLSNIEEFVDRLETVGMQNLNILKPMAVWDVTFWDWCVIASDEDVILLSRIHRILFPNHEQSWSVVAQTDGIEINGTSSRQYRSWRNRHCDAQGIWAHVKDEGDLFVTSDMNYINKTKELEALGVRMVLTPEDAALMVRKIH